MCTVSYIPHSKGFILTSSRDEKVRRLTDLPKVYPQKNCKLLYPKDSIANGTWIAVSDSKRYACLLNGAFDKHESKGNYQKSRGQILLEAFNYSNFLDFIEAINLQGIEPFTLLLIDASENIMFHELRWDEEQKYVKEINPTLPQIWSSSTLYEKEIKEKRELLFYDWITRFRDEEYINILNFHIVKHDLKEEDNILMNRSEEMKTVSVSQLLVLEEIEKFTYHDLLANIQTTHLLHEI